MTTVRFIAEIDADQTIHPPADVRLMPGMAEVIVVQPADTPDECHEEVILPAGVPEIAKELWRFANGQGVALLPDDLAMNHDHYLHGAPKGIDQP